MLRNYAKMTFKEFVTVWGCQSTASPFFDDFILETDFVLVKFMCLCLVDMLY